MVQPMLKESMKEEHWWCPDLSGAIFVDAMHKPFDSGPAQNGTYREDSNSRQHSIRPEDEQAPDDKNWGNQTPEKPRLNLAPRQRDHREKTYWKRHGQNENEGFLPRDCDPHPFQQCGEWKH